MGGMYERLIRSIKQAFERTYGHLALHARQFETSVIEIEAVINARPITYIEDDPEAPILTPAHFLQTRYPAIPIETNIDEREDIMSKLWKASRQHIAEFWQHWSERYVMDLRDRHDTLRKRNNLPATHPKKGDLVLLADPDRKRIQWRMALVERLVASNDGVVRSVQIKMPNGSRTIRPVIKLAPLGLAVDLPQTDDQQLNINRNAIILQVPEGAEQSQQQSIEEEEEEIVVLGLEDI